VAAPVGSAPSTILYLCRLFSAKKRKVGDEKDDGNSSPKKAKRDGKTKDSSTLHVNDTSKTVTETPRSKKKKRKSEVSSIRNDTSEKELDMDSSGNVPQDSVPISVAPLSSEDSTVDIAVESVKESVKEHSSELVVGSKTPKSAKKRKHKGDELLITKLSFDSPLLSLPTDDSVSVTPKVTETSTTPKSSQKKKKRRKSMRLEQKASS
jgi:hypothetical protein